MGRGQVEGIHRQALSHVSLLATVESAVARAFSAAGDLILQVTWLTQTFGEYDTATGTQAVTTASRTCAAVEAEWEEGQVQREGLSEHAIRLYIQRSDFLKAPAVEPKRGDKIVVRGKQYTVKSAKHEGVNVLWEIHADV